MEWGQILVWSERNSQLISSFLYLLLADDPLGKVALIADKCEDNLIDDRSLQLRNPGLDVDEGRVIGQVEHEQGSIGSPIIHWRHAPEFLLASSVPHLHIHPNSIHRDATTEEGRSNRGGELFGIGFRHVLGHQARLADT